MLKILETNRKASEAARVRATEALKKFRAREDIGFPHLPERKQLWDQAGQRGRELSRKFEKMIVLGIGGSSMGGRVLKEVLEPAGQNRLDFWDNVDGVEFERNWSQLGDLAKICWVVISKSGSTIETLALTDLVVQAYQEEKSLKLSDHFNVVSEQTDNTLTTWAKEHSIPIFELPKDVGGRFSVLTPVGVLPAAFVGADEGLMRQGAGEALSADAELIEFTAQYLDSFDREEWISLFWYYNSSLRWFGAWVQQLWAESLGKKVDRNNSQAPRVSTPLSCIGASDQHSILQQVMEGHKDKFVCFLRVKSSEQKGAVLRQTQFPSKQKLLEGKPLGQLLAAEAEATYQALSESGVSAMVTEIETLEAKDICYLFMFFQMVTAVLGEALDIDAFDQPGVELGKRLARSILEK